MGEEKIMMITLLGRYYTVFKKEGNSIVAKDAFVDLTEGSPLLSRYARSTA